VSALLDALNHVLTAALAGDGPHTYGPVTVHTVHLHASGAHVTGELTHAWAEGAFELTLRVDPERDGRQAVRVHAARLPDRLSPMLEAFRDTLTRSELRLDLAVLPASDVPPADGDR